MYNRDFLATPWGNDTLVVTCDSIGAIGAMELDVVSTTGLVVGRFLARTALMELLATGAKLISLSCTLSVDPSNASPVLDGVFLEAGLTHPDPRSICIITTEKNVPTRQTGVGITCIGRIDGHKPRTGRSQRGDVLVAIGTPRVGAEVSLNDTTIADLATLQALLDTGGVGDISPAGSKGILYEAEVIARYSRLELETDAREELFVKSAGPATSIVCSCRPHILGSLATLRKPLHIIGTLKEEHQ